MRSKGQVTGHIVRFPYDCACKKPLKLHYHWNGPNGVPAHFRDVRMATLEPSNRSKLAPEHQLSLIHQIQDRPNDSYFLCGAPGSGKTHLMTALYRTALETWVDLDAVLAKQRIAVFRITASVLLDQHVQYEKKSFDDDTTPIPLVPVAKFQWPIADGYGVCLFIEELDKIIPSEFKLNKLCQLVDIVWASNGQLVATSNKSPAQLLKKWDSDAAGT